MPEFVTVRNRNRLFLKHRPEISDDFFGKGSFPDEVLMPPDSYFRKEIAILSAENGCRIDIEEKCYSINNCLMDFTD